MSARRPRRPALVLLGLLAASTGGCSWLLGVSENPVVAEADAALPPDAAPDAPNDRDSGTLDAPDVEEAAVEDAPVE